MSINVSNNPLAPKYYTQLSPHVSVGMDSWNGEQDAYTGWSAQVGLTALFRGKYNPYLSADFVGGQIKDVNQTSLIHKGFEGGLGGQIDFHDSQATLPIGIYGEVGSANGNLQNFGAVKSYRGAGVKTGLNIHLGHWQLGLSVNYGLRTYMGEESGALQRGGRLGLGFNLGWEPARKDFTSSVPVVSHVASHTVVNHVVPNLPDSASTPISAPHAQPPGTSVSSSSLPTQPAVDTPLAVGQLIPTLDSRWVDLLPTGPLDEQDADYDGSDSCLPQYGNQVRILSLDPTNRMAQVEYVALRNTAGTRCDQGVKFNLSFDELEEYKKEYPEMRRKELSFISQIEQAVENPSPFPKQPTIKGDRWVHYVSVPPDKQDQFKTTQAYLKSPLGFGDEDRCLIEDGEPIEKLGQVTNSQGESYDIGHYLSYDDGGTECDYNTIIMVKTSSLNEDVDD